MEAPLIYPDGRMMVVGTADEWVEVIDVLAEARVINCAVQDLIELIQEHIL